MKAGHSIQILFALIALLETPVVLPDGRAEEGSNAPIPNHHYTFEQSVRSLGDEIVHPKDPYQVIPGKNPNDWFLIIEPTGWLPSVSGSASVKGLPPVDINKKTDLNTIKKALNHLDSAFGGKLEVRKGRWGLFGDGFFAQLSDAGSPPGPLYSSAAVVNTAGTASLSIAYRVLDDRRGYLDVYAGARYNYLGLAVNTSTDPAAIQNISQESVSRISQQVGNMVNSAVANMANATQQAVASTVQQSLSQDVVVQALQSPALQAQNIQTHLLDVAVIRQGLARSDGFDGFGRYVEAKALRDALGQVGNQIQDLVQATAQARLAQTQAQIAQAQNRVAQAQNNLANALSQKIQSILPTAASGSQQWVDPLVGMRGQVNLTRVLFLACCADVGGFGVGSQITWNTTASVGVNFTRQIFGEVGYRYNYTDYSNSSGFLFKASEYGGFIGIGIKL